MPVPFCTGLLSRLAAAAVVVVIVGGCADARFGSELSRRPHPQRLSQAEQTTVRLPQEQPFNIALPRESEEAGLDGSAEADASADKFGAATVRAAVTHSGLAEGLFQLGHALRNDTERQADFAFRIRFHYEFEVTQEPVLDLPDAYVGLRLYARDSVGRLLHDVKLVDHSTENGATHQQSDQNIDFAVTLGPGQSVDVFLAGQAKVDISAGRSASGVLELSGLTMEVTTRPAPAVRTARHGPQ